MPVPSSATHRSPATRRAAWRTKLVFPWKSIWARWSLLLISGAAIAIAFFGNRVSSEYLARSLVKRIEGEEISAALQDVRRLALLDDAGWLALVDLIERPADRVWVSDAARRELMAKLDVWKGLSPEMAADKIQKLAARLKDRAAGWNEDTLSFVGELTLRLLEWPMGASEESPEFIANCEFLVHLSGVRNNRSSTESDKHPLGFDLAAQPPGPIIESDRLTSPESSPGLPTTVDIAETYNLGPEPPAYPIGNAAATSQAASGQPPAAPTPTDTGDPATKPEADVAISPGIEPAIEASDPYHLRRDEVLIRQMSSRQLKDVLAAAAELKRRGYTEYEIRVAEDAVDEDVYVRRGLVERLSYLPNINTKRWLVLLSEDTDLDVRRQAVMMLATMVNTDPQVVAHLRKIELHEDDPWIRKRIQSILR